MKISPLPASGVPTFNQEGNPTPTQLDSVRTLRMTTNATPLPNQNLAISDNNEAQTAEATQPLSPQLALLAKQKRALQVKEREILDREKALQSQTQGSAVDVARLKSDPLRVLLENGVTYDQLTQAILANQDNSEVTALKAKLDALEKGIDQKFLDKDAQAEKQVLAEMQREATHLVATNDDYELVRETKSTPKVIELIERTYRKSGEVLPVAEALRLYEDELFKVQQRLSKLKKMQSLQPALQPQQRQQQGMRTLTNKDTATVPLSAKARAMAAFYGTYKR